jgi:hypothetical protein
MNDRKCELSRAAGPRRHFPKRGTGTSADVVCFILPPPRHGRALTDFPTIAFRAAVRPEAFAETHADTAPCEIVPFECDEP